MSQLACLSSGFDSRTPPNRVMATCRRFPAAADCACLLALILTLSGPVPPKLQAQPPEQFRVWGTVAPELKPIPSGWRPISATETTTNLTSHLHLEREIGPVPARAGTTNRPND